MAGKLLLPEFGGSAYVWCATLLFFQSVLIIGYFASRWLAQASNHQRLAAFILLSLSGLFALVPRLMIPQWLPMELQPFAALAPFAGLSIGLFSTTPLLHRAQADRTDFSIYAWSNAGALAGLISYPFLVEPLTTLTLQRWVWVLGGSVICILGLGRSRPGAEPEPQPAAQQSTRWQWWLLPGISSAALLATTNQLSYEASAGPLTWALPLSLFLGSYVWAFSADRTNRLKIIVALGLASMLGQSVAPLRSWQMLAMILISGAAVMAFCHIVLASTRTADSHRFYLSGAIGGAVGSALMFIVIPRLLADPIEFATLALGTLGIGAFISGSLLVRLGLTTLTVVATGAVIATHSARYAGEVAHARSLYACLRVIKRADRNFYSLISNTTVHGTEDRDHPDREMAYFSPSTGLGLAVAEKRRHNDPISVGVIGLGAGTINRLLTPKDVISYFEINPQVEDFARKYFTYLQTPQTRVVIGDGRKCLEQEPNAQFDILVLDAFTGDAIPAHLLTSECALVYMRHLKPNGWLAVHFTNAHVDLCPVIASMAKTMGMRMEVIRTEKISWAILRPGVPDPSQKTLEWTDEKNSIVPVLK